MELKQYTVISTFAGCGGSSLGYKEAGFKELLAIDFDKNAHETFKLNFDCPAWLRDIKEIDTKEILEFCNIKKGELDVLDGSPPCQGFSTAGKRVVLDERNNLFKEFARLIDGLQPKIFVMENVSGMIKGKMKGYFIEIITELKSLNYQVKAKLMNAKYYNVPQSRKRLIFIGVRNDLNIKPSYPKPNNKLISFKNATRGLKEYTDRKLPKILLEIGKYQPKNKWSTNIKIYKKIKGNLAGSFSTCWAIQNKVLGTITKSEISISGIVHPNRKRYLNLSEVKRCCSFPDTFKLTDRKNGYQRLGNSVMPKFMQAIAENIKINILDKYYKKTN